MSEGSEMAKQLERRASIEFLKLAQLGAAVCGRIVRNDKNENGRFVEMSPLVFRANARDGWQKYGHLAVGLSTDLERQVPEGVTGGWYLFVFVRTKDTGGKSPMKIFDVFELAPDEAGAIARGGPLPVGRGGDDDTDGGAGEEIPDGFGF